MRRGHILPVQRFRCDEFRGTEMDERCQRLTYGVKEPKKSCLRDPLVGAMQLGSGLSSSFGVIGEAARALFSSASGLCCGDRLAISTKSSVGRVLFRREYLWTCHLSKRDRYARVLCRLKMSAPNHTSQACI